MESLVIVCGAWRHELSSRVEFTPKMGTHGDELAMNQRMTYSIRGLFTRVRGRRILGSLALTKAPKGRSPNPRGLQPRVGWP